MSLQSNKVYFLLLTEHFGEVVGKVAENLQWGPKVMSNIVSSSGLSLVKVKKALSVLIQYGLVMFEKGKNSWTADYTLLPEKILLILRYPKYLNLIKSKYGVVTQLLLEEVLKHGCIVGSQAILNVSARIKAGIDVSEGGLVNLRNNLHTLISNQYLMRCASPVVEEGEDTSVPKLCIKESQMFQSPHINMSILADMEVQKSVQDPGDKGVYWKTNFDRFHQDMRDEIMITAMRSRFDDNAAELMKHLLELMYLRTEPWAPDSNPVPILELKELITKKTKNPHLIQYFEQYIKIMEEDSSQFIRRTGETSSSQLSINLPKAFFHLSSTAIENIIDQRFGYKASRIFRLICAKKFIEQEQVQQLAMIPDKEAKQITYKLLQENFIQMQELRKPTVGSGPNKSYFLFHVDFNLVVHMVIGICHKAIFNALTRRRTERSNHSRLIDKNEKVEAAVRTMRENGTDETQITELIEEWVSPPERNLLDTVEKMMEKLELAELQIDNTLFLLHLFTYYQCVNMPKVSTKK